MLQLKMPPPGKLPKIHPEEALPRIVTSSSARPGSPQVTTPGSYSKHGSKRPSQLSREDKMSVDTKKSHLGFFAWIYFYCHKRPKEQSIPSTTQRPRLLSAIGTSEKSSESLSETPKKSSDSVSLKSQMSGMSQDFGQKRHIDRSRSDQVQKSVELLPPSANRKLSKMVRTNTEPAGQMAQESELASFNGALGVSNRGLHALQESDEIPPTSKSTTTNSDLQRDRNTIKKMLEKSHIKLTLEVERLKYAKLLSGLPKVNSYDELDSFMD